MKHLVLEAWTRTTNGTAGAVAVRNEGCIPCILVGHHLPPVPVKIKSGDMTRILKEGGRNALLDLSIDGTSAFAMLKTFTRNPVSRRIIHVDFQRVSADEMIEASVPLNFVGQLAVEFQGYVVEHELNTVQLQAVPDSLPTRINVDISSIHPTHPIHLADIAVPEGVTLIGEPTQIVAVLVAPRLVTAEGDDETAEVAEAAAPAPEA